MEDQKEEEGSCFLSEVKSSSLTELELNNILNINLGREKGLGVSKEAGNFLFFEGAHV